ncbi:MAG: phosphopantetheine-binding protein [Candidatus Enteromonas sp.]|nr:phosphopantetheine-binding protein [bacterium]MDD6917756.1 phosphopantetheine-binding protein [bacterium]MDY6101063.1 phosphopantetheine-binding protein [Candidatus Enteromonas sp.]
MNREEIKEKAIDLIHSCVPDLSGVDINEESNINTDASVDSMSFIYLMTQIEAEFGIEIPQKKWAKLCKFGDLVDEIHLRLSKAK